MSDWYDDGTSGADPGVGEGTPEVPIIPEIPQVPEEPTYPYIPILPDPPLPGDPEIIVLPVVPIILYSEAESIGIHTLHTTALTL